MTIGGTYSKCMVCGLTKRNNAFILDDIAKDKPVCKLCRNKKERDEKEVNE